MIPIKSEAEIEIMRQGGRRLSQVFQQVLAEIKPGVRLSELDQLAEKLILAQGGKPSFKMVRNYDWTICLNVGQGVVHGIPNDQELKANDLVSLDIGLFFKGFHTDMARTIQVDGQTDKFLETGKRALKRAIAGAKPGRRIGHVSQIIEKEIKKAGYQPIRTLTGHGVGQKLHEDPQIFCFLKEEIKHTALIKPGMVLAIEVIYSQGSPEIVVKDDGWTIETKDGQLAGLFEDTIAVTDNDPQILTRS